MKKTTTTLALLAVLSLATVSCQKEGPASNASTTECAVSQYNYRYTINGREYYANLRTDADWQQLLGYLLDLTQQGNTVSIQSINRTTQTVLAKRAVTFVTTDKNEAYDWAMEMASQGYTVTIEFDKKTGEYTCTATN